MQHVGTCPLETPRLILRRFSAEDAAAMYANWASDPEVTKYLMWPPHDHVDTTGEILKTWLTHYGEPDYYHWAVTLKENGEAPIGDMAVVNHNDKM